MLFQYNAIIWYYVLYLDIIWQYDDKNYLLIDLCLYVIYIYILYIILTKSKLFKIILWVLHQW